MKLWCVSGSKFYEPQTPNACRTLESLKSSIYSKQSEKEREREKNLKSTFSISSVFYFCSKNVQK